MTPSSVFVVLFSVSLCQALVPDFPLATPVQQDPLYQGIVGWSPKPTRAPVVPRDFFEKRDNVLANQASYILVAPDQTCGYVSALAGAQFQCGTSTPCVYLPVTGTGSNAYGAVGCCTDFLNCGFRTGCVDSKAILGSGCDSGCQADSNTMKCSDSSAPYCNSLRYAYPSATVEQFFCGTNNASTWATAFTTYSGQTSARVFTTLLLADLRSSAASASSKSAATRTSSSTSTSTGSTTSTSSASTTSTTPGPTTSSPGGGGGSSNTGAIAGGIVGGFAVLGLIGAGAFFFYKRKNGKKEDVAAAPATTPMGDIDPSKPGGNGNWQQGGYYTPGQQPQSGYYSPGQQPPQQYMSAYGNQYQPVPVEMPSSDYVQAQQQVVHEKSASTPVTGNLSTPSTQFMSPASTHNRPISEMDSTSPSHR